MEWQCAFCNQMKVEMRHCCALCRRSICEDCIPLKTTFAGQYIYCRECLNLGTERNWRKQLADMVHARWRNTEQKEVL